MKNLFLSSLLMMFFFDAFSQTVGSVKDVNNSPIIAANIYFPDEDILLTTDQRGEFYIEQRIYKNCFIHVYKHGYHTKLLKYSNKKDLQITLDKLHVDLDEVGVKESFYHLGSGKLTNIENKKLDFLNSNSMLESLTELSGVDIISSGTGIQKIVLRGLSGMRVVTYLNGMKINNQQWANDHGIGFTDLGLDEVELIKGASALKYGSEAIGGLLYFKDQPFVSNENFGGFVATKFNNSSFLSNSQFGVKWNKRNFFINLYGQYSLSSDYRLPNNDFLFNSRFKQNAIKFSIAHKFKKVQNIFRYQLHNETTGIPAHIHGDPREVDLIQVTSSSLDLPDDYKPTRPTQFIDNQLFIYESNYINDNIKLSFHAGHFINHLVEYEKWTLPGFGLTIQHSRFMPNLRYQIDNLTLNLGSSLDILDNLNGEGEKKLVPNASTRNIGPYIIFDYEKPNIGFNAGIRYDSKSIRSNDEMLSSSYENLFTSISFSSGIFYKYLDHVFRISYSEAFRAPDFSELFSNGVHHGTNRYEIGDVGLNIEHADQIDLKYQWSNNHFGIVLNSFVQYITDFITISPLDSFISSNRVYKYLQFDRVTISGVEMNIHYHPHQLHALHFEQSYSFLKTENKNSKYGLALTPANSIKTQALLDLNSLLTFEMLDYFAIFHIYKFQQNSFAEYEELTKDYNIINIQLGLKLSDSFRATISLNNLLNEEYSPHISRVRGVAGGVPAPGRFLNINLKYDF